MPACDICKQTPIEGDVLCDDCRDSITRLDAICHRQPDLLTSGMVKQTLDLQAGAVAAA